MIVSNSIRVLRGPAISSIMRTGIRIRPLNHLRCLTIPMRTFTSFNQPLLFHGSRAVLNKENKDPEKKQDQEGNKEKDEEKSKPEEKEQGKNKKKDMDQDEKDIRDQIRENLKKKNPNLDPNNIKIYQLDNKSLARAFAGIFSFHFSLHFSLRQTNETKTSYRSRTSRRTTLSVV